MTKIPGMERCTFFGIYEDSEEKEIEGNGSENSSEKDRACCEVRLWW